MFFLYVGGYSSNPILIQIFLIFFTILFLIFDFIAYFGYTKRKKEFDKGIITYSKVILHRKKSTKISCIMCIIFSIIADVIIITLGAAGVYSFDAYSITNIIFAYILSSSLTILSLMILYASRNILLIVTNEEIIYVNIFSEVEKLDISTIQHYSQEYIRRRSGMYSSISYDGIYFYDKNNNVVLKAHGIEKIEKNTLFIDYLKSKNISFSKKKKD